MYHLRITKPNTSCEQAESLNANISNGSLLHFALWNNCQHVFHVKTNLICLRHQIYWTELPSCCWLSSSESVCPAHFLLIPYFSFICRTIDELTKGILSFLNLFLRHSNKVSCRHIYNFFLNWFFFSVLDFFNEQWS